MSQGAPKQRVCVVGAGVIGLSTALRLCQEVKGVQVTVVADTFLADTTSSGAAGLWEPYKLGSTPAELIQAWAGETYQYLQVSESTCPSQTPDLHDAVVMLQMNTHAR